MNKQNLLYGSFFASFILTIVGSLFKIMHWPFASMLLTIGLISLALFVLMSILEIMNSKKIEGTEKFMWVIGFLFFGLITGLIYMLSARKRII
jgi:NADH:ubiquinone oxidoreductase subunit 2 (subunit N)